MSAHSRFKVRNVLSALLFCIVASVAIVLAADYLLYIRGTWSGWGMTEGVASHEDAKWWQSHVGPLPDLDIAANFVTPATVYGRGGPDRDGYPAPLSGRVPFGLNSYRIQPKSGMIRGGVLVSPTTHAWRAGVEFPGGMAVERIFIGYPGMAPPHPTLGEWDVRILPAGLALNTLLLAGPLCIVVAVLARSSAACFRATRGHIRKRRGQCSACGYTLLSTQSTCPECGAARRRL